MLRPAFLVDWKAMLLRLAYNIYLPCLKLVSTQGVAIQIQTVKWQQKKQTKEAKQELNYKS